MNPRIGAATDSLLRRCGLSAVQAVRFLTDPNERIDTMTENTKPSAVLTEMQTILDERGWCQGYYIDPDAALDLDNGSVCLVGAYLLATGLGVQRLYEGKFDCSMIRLPYALRLALADLAPTVPEKLSISQIELGDAVRFNDNDHTTRENIDLLLKRAIEIADDQS